MNKTVAIYRHQLAKPSESFIYTPLKYYSKYQTKLIGTEIWPNTKMPYPLYAPPHFTKIDRIIHRITGHNRYLNQWFIDNKPDIIHAHFAIDGLYAAYFAKKYRIPLIVTLHGFDVTRPTRQLLTSGNLSWMKFALQRKKLFKQADRFICVSDFIYHKAIAAGFPAKKLQKHYIGVDTNIFRPSDDISVTADNEFKILHVARLTEKKGTQYLLEALKTINDETVKLLIAGDGDLLGSLKDQAAKLNIQNQITFLGFVPYEKIQTLMAECQLLCVPSVTAADGDAEGLGMVFLEAAASGLPIVATRHGGIPEAVLDGKTGTLVEEKNVAQLTLAIQEFRNKPTKTTQYSAESRSWVRQKFNIETNTHELERIYDEVIGSYR